MLYVVNTMAYFSISYLILSEAADQDGRFDTLISSLGQLVVELLTFVLKCDIRTSKRTNACQI